LRHLHFSEYRIVGVHNEEDAKDPHEVVAFAIEKHAFGYTNPLAESIFSVLKDKGVIE